MAIFTGAKTIVSMTLLTTPPATQDATGYAALTYAELGCIESLGSFGATRSQTEFTCLNTGDITRLPGAIDRGQLEMTIAYDDTTTAFPVLIDAVEDGLTRYFKIELPNKQNDTGTNAIWYFPGKVTANAVNIGGADDVVTTSTTVTLEGKGVRIDSTAG